MGVFWLSGFLLVYSHFLYPALLWLLSRLAPRRAERVDEGHLPVVSMIVAAYNEERSIREKLQNCREVDYPAGRIEFLFGSDGSTDGTNRVLEEGAGGGVRFLAFERRRGKAGVLNDLVKEAAGEILVFSDANSMYEPDAVRRLVRHFASPDVGLVCGRLVLLNPDDNPAARGEGLYWRYENFLKRLEGERGALIAVNGAIHTMRRELYVPVPSYKMMNDDIFEAIEVLKQGKKVIYEPEAVAFEYASSSMEDEVYRKSRMGECALNTLPHMLPLLNPARGMPALVVWSHKVLRWAGPFLLAAAFLSNVALLGKILYNASMLAQLALYGAAAAGFLLDRLGVRSRVLLVPYYFVSVNVGLVVGYARALLGRGAPVWKRVER